MSSLIKDRAKYEGNWSPDKSGVDLSTTEGPTTSIVEITPTLARHYLETCNTQNRKLRIGIIKKYANFMLKGEWVITDQAISFDVNNRLLNGQHRLHAVIHSGLSIKFLVARNLPTDSYKYMDQGALRSQHDVHGYSKDVSSVISNFNQVLTTKKILTFTQHENARNYLLPSHDGGKITLELFVDMVVKTKAKVMTAGLPLICLLYWCDKSGELDYLINFFYDIVGSFRNMEKQRTLSSRGLSIIKLIRDEKIGAFQGFNLTKKFLSLYDPSKKHNRLIFDANHETILDLRNWVLKVIGE